MRAGRFAFFPNALAAPRRRRCFAAGRGLGDEPRVRGVPTRGGHQALDQRHLRAGRDRRDREGARDAQELAALDRARGDDASAAASRDGGDGDGADVVGAPAARRLAPNRSASGSYFPANAWSREELTLEEGVLGGGVVRGDLEEAARGRERVGVAAEAVERIARLLQLDEQLGPSAACDATASSRASWNWRARRKHSARFASAAASAGFAARASEYFRAAPAKSPARKSVAPSSANRIRLLRALLLLSGEVRDDPARVGRELGRHRDVCEARRAGVGEARVESVRPRDAGSARGRREKSVRIVGRFSPGEIFARRPITARGFGAENASRGDWARSASVAIDRRPGAG